ncbi:hypothetical protein BEP19_03325 [Ammoniphilus oxalaticus]|uniref:Lipoprotein n=1 Tax=Ammoniphilus oxalaticus TaxID=66863 RepID=A0A419SP15_9BACL|nr:hypothetical protein [Ammoniphilus oxalaticus]RKD25969.1 hypothetical protein BEP19_03325 [Ammoniphilus oxalaticus]
MKKKITIFILGLMTILLSACSTESDTVNHNISKSADSFEVNRRIVFFNGITDKYLLTVEGLCSLDITGDKALRVTCKVGEGEYKRHYLGLSDNVSYFVEQVDSANVDPFHYRVVFRPESIVPDIDIQTSK